VRRPVDAMRNLRARVMTGGGWEGFGPYVAAIDAAGVLWFTARGSSGEGVLCRAGDAGPSVVEWPGGVPICLSHPAPDGQGGVAVFARDGGGRSRPLHGGVGGWRDLSSSCAAIAEAGPLGPTADAGGAVAFRARTEAGTEAVVRVEAGGTGRIVLEAEAEWIGFEGLPLCLPDATVVRATRADGSQAILRQEGDRRAEILVGTGRDFSSLGRFPSMNRDRLGVFAARSAAGDSGLWVVEGGGGIRLVAGREGGFSEVRGGLVADDGGVVFFATPTGGRPGVYAGPRADRDRIIGIGDVWQGREVAEFAANAVSINRHGQVAVRLAFADGGEALARWDPPERPWRPG
jgi:hypothetical protein